MRAEPHFSRWLLLPGLAVALLGAVLYHPRLSEREALPPESAFGCFVADDYPAILIERTGARAAKSREPAAAFRIEMSKTGLIMKPLHDIVLFDETDSARKSTTLRSRYIISFKNRVGGKWFGDFDIAELDAFEAVTLDDRALMYVRAPRSECAKAAGA